jgi:hypothetical protein
MFIWYKFAPIGRVWKFRLPPVGGDLFGFGRIPAEAIDTVLEHVHRWQLKCDTGSSVLHREPSYRWRPLTPMLTGRG